MGGYVSMLYYLFMLFSDMIFASEVLSALKRSQGSSEEQSSSSSIASTASTLDAVPESEQDSIFKWSHQAVRLLIEEYRKREEDIISGKTMICYSF